MKCLNDFKNKYGLSGLYSKPTEYMEYEDKTKEVISDVKKIIDKIVIIVKNHYVYSTSQINEITSHSEDITNDLIKNIIGEIKINIYD